MLLGLTGTFASGKGAAADYLVLKGFLHYSAREFLTREIQTRGLEVNRTHMVEVGNDLRARHGAAHVVLSMARQAQAEERDAVIESLRVPAEVTALQQVGGIVLAFDAEQRVRYERLVRRGLLATDRVTFEEFSAEEDREMDSEDPNKQNIRKSIQLADYRIENNGTLEELYGKIDGILKEITNTQASIINY